MKRVIKIFLLIILLLLVGCGKQVTEEEAREALYNHLIERYGEEFEIGYMQFRSSEDEMWYQAKIYPTKYKGTPRGKDEYYYRTGTVDIEKGIFGEKISFVGDVYRKVLLNESANEFYLPKLKELFGENVLPVLDIVVSKMAVKPDFYTTYNNRKEEGKGVIIKGGIYIFGRVESDEDREWYRKQIYEFVQFMKQTGTFEYVELDIMIVDERILTKEFRENLLQTQNKLAKNPKTRADIEKRKERRIIMGELNDYFNKETDYSEVLNSYIKSDVLERGSSAMAKNSSLLYLRLYSPKLIISKGWNESGNPELYEEIKNYDNIQDVKFEWEAW